MGSAVEIVAAIQAILNNVAGIREAPNYPPEQINMPLTAVSYCSSGVMREASLVTPGCYEVDETYAVLLYLPMKDLPREIATLMPYVRSVPLALLADPTLTGTVTCINDMRYRLQEAEYGGVMMRGYRFEIDVSVKAVPL